MSAINHFVIAIKDGNLPLVQSMLDEDPALANLYDTTGATPLHYAAFHGHQPIVRLLIEKGAGINNADSEFGATPAGWAIEYLRELGGHLGIELEDLSYAIQQGDVRWTTRFLQRFPALKNGRDKKGKPFRQLALESGNEEIIKLFE
jgi:ankyrin repeat protein